MMMGNGVGGSSSYQAHYQENLNKNRPQTSYRLATKNSFQAIGANGSGSHNTSMTNIHQSSSQNNLHSQGGGHSSMGGHQQH